LLFVFRHNIIRWNSFFVISKFGNSTTFLDPKRPAGPITVRPTFGTVTAGLE
jgi:hypothetical protein